MLHCVGRNYQIQIYCFRQLSSSWVNTAACCTYVTLSVAEKFSRRQLHWFLLCKTLHFSSAL